MNHNRGIYVLKLAKACFLSGSLILLLFNCKHSKEHPENLAEVKEGISSNTLLGIGQRQTLGPIVTMIENYRTQLLWHLFMQDKGIQKGLLKPGFSSPYINDKV